jgi:hypothetical protein
LRLFPKSARVVLVHASLIACAFPGAWRSQVRAERIPSERMASTEDRTAGQINADPSIAPQRQGSGEGNLFALRVLDMLERRPNVSSRVRHRVRLGEHLLTGSGRYWQQGVANERRSRLELQIQVAGKTASLVQVFDRRYLWTDRQLPSGRRITRLDPVRLQEGLSNSSPVVRHGQPTSANSLLPTAVSRGGLCGQLADLIEHFDFGPPRPIQLDDYSMVAMIGRWKPEPLVRLCPQFAASAPSNADANDSEAEWPDQLPHHVLLMVGVQDLFPYLIEHRRYRDVAAAGTGASTHPVDDPLARYEQFEVQFTAPLDERLFESPHSNDIKWDDETPELIVEMGK